MKKLAAVLLSITMILTTCFTMPIVSFAETIPTSSYSITPTAFEQIFSQPATISTTGQTKTASAWFDIKPVIAGSYNLNNVNIADDANIDSATIKVINAQGQLVTGTDGKYSFSACTGTDKYYVQVNYVVNAAVTAEKIDVGLKAQVDPIAITTDNPAQIELAEKTAVYYSFTPTTKGGYTFALEDIASASGSSNNAFNAQVLLPNGTALSGEFVNEEGTTKSCALFLNANSTYIIKVFTEKVGDYKLKLSVKSVFDGTTGANITVRNTLNVSSDVIPLQLYCFQNRKISYWYKVSIAETGYYELSFKNKNAADSDDVVSIVLHEDEQLLDELIDDAAFAGDDASTFYVKLDKDTQYFLQLRPVSSSQTTDLDVTFKQHSIHDHYLSVDETGGVSYGCVCKDPDEEYYYYEIDEDETTIPSLTYTGSALKATPNFGFYYYSSFNDQKPVVDPKCYTITYKNSAGNKVDAPKAVGKYTATIKFGKSSTAGSKDSLAGLDSITKTFKVIPKSTVLNSLTAAKAGFTAKWKKITAQTDGYQLQYSVNKNFSNAKTATITKNSTVSKKISNLKSGKTYYVRVRTFKTVNKTKYYSAWSNSKTVKTK